MNKRHQASGIRHQSIACALGALLLTGAYTAQASGEGEEVHLVDKMMLLQYFTHKAGLSIRAENLELADFYLHEMEEVLGEVGQIESYDGQPVGQLSGAMLEPSIHELEEAVDSGNPERALTAYKAAIDACNACHVATTFGYIKLEDRSTENPFMQSFNP